MMLSLAVLITIFLTMALGILCGYGVVTTLLRTFGHRRETTPPAPALATGISGTVTGD